MHSWFAGHLGILFDWVVQYQSLIRQWNQNDLGPASAKNLADPFSWPSPITGNSGVAGSRFINANYCNQDFWCLVDENGNNVACYDFVDFSEVFPQLSLPFGG